MTKAKKATPPKKTTEKLSPGITCNVLSKANCKSLSGKAILGYEIGIDSAGEHHVRISTCNGGGFWNRDWVPTSAIETILAKCNPGQPITAVVLYPLFRGRSVNTPGYLLAVLRELGLLQSHKDTKRTLELAEPLAHKAAMASITDAKPTAKTAAKKKAKAAPKRKATRKK